MITLTQEIARRPTCVDLFAGAGGFSQAALDLDFDIRAAVELNPHACTTYKYNICSKTNTTLFDSDIRDLDHKKLTSLFDINDTCDVVLGGPPCQGFSVHRIKDSGVDDPRNDLIHLYFNIVKALKPKFFILENVAGILWDRHASSLSLFYQKAQESGYNVLEPALLDARNFGIPQRRKRVFILGVSSSIDAVKNWPPLPTHGSETTRKENQKLQKWTSCKHVFKAAPEGDINNVHMKHGPELVQAFRATPLNGGSRRDSGRILACHKEHDGHKDVYGRIDPRMPAPTMTTACINPSKGRFVHPTQHHGITARQAARIQTFPDTYQFFGGLIAAGQQIGNAVPPDLGKVVLKAILSNLT